MWTDAQRDGRPAEYKWHPLRKFRNSIHCTTPQSYLADPAAGVPYCNAADIGERKIGRKVILYVWQNSVTSFPLGARAPENVYIFAYKSIGLAVFHAFSGITRVAR